MLIINNQILEWYNNKKTPKLKIFSKLKTNENIINIHNIINLNSNTKFKFINDVELLRRVKNRESITKYLVKYFYENKTDEKINHKRRYYNFLKWHKKINDTK